MFFIRFNPKFPRKFSTASETLHDHGNQVNENFNVPTETNLSLETEIKNAMKTKMDKITFERQLQPKSSNSMVITESEGVKNMLDDKVPYTKGIGKFPQVNYFIQNVIFNF